VRIEALVDLQRAEQFLQGVGSDRLHHVVIETGAAGAKAIFLPPVARDGDQNCLGGLR